MTRPLTWSATTELPTLQIPSRYNIAAALLEPHLAGEHRDHPAVECDGRSWTYAQIAELVNRAGNGLRALGVAREQRVLIALPDSPELIAACLGAIRIGAVAVPCNTFFGPAEYAYFLRETRAAVVVTTRDLFARMEPAASPDLRAVITDRDENDDDGCVRAWSRWIAAASSELAAAD